MNSRRLNPIAAAMLILLPALGVAVGLAGQPTPPPPKPPIEAKEAFRRLFAEGVTFLNAGHTQEALVIFEAAQKLNPHVVEVKVNIGFAHLARQENDKALEQFETVLAERPSQVNAYYGLGMALQAVGREEEALGALQTFLHLEKEGTEFWRLAGAAVWELGDKIRRQRAGGTNLLPVPGMTTDGKPALTYDDLRKDAAKPAEVPPK